MMKTNIPLTDNGPCDCNAANRDLEVVDQHSVLTGAQYETIRCGNCKAVFAAEPKNECSCGGVGDDSEKHLQWCEESQAEWPPFQSEQTNTTKTTP